MSQALSQIPQHLLQQQQRLTPQLIQRMSILQLNALALESRINQEVDANPALDASTGEEGLILSGEGEFDPGPADGERALVVDGDNAQDFERLTDFVREYDFIDDDYSGTRSREWLSEGGNAKLEAMANTIARPDSLQDYLLEQWGLVDATPRIATLGRVIIESIAPSGRLETPLADLTALLDPPATEDEWLEALDEVQQLDPPGVGARSLQECLLLQLDALPGDNKLEHRILSNHFEDLQRNRLPVIARALNVDVDEVKAALQIIGRLSLQPGTDVTTRELPPIVPDVIVEYDADQDRYDVRLARGGTRELRIAPEFRRLLEESRNDKATREFVKQKIEAAHEIIDAVKFRRDRLLEVARAVVDEQRDFLDHGEQRLKVLRMSDLAVRFGCDPSTISRAVDQKYMQTPRGIYPLRMFFTGGAETEDGESLGWQSIKAKVKEIVDAEDKSSPLSDDAIVEKLTAQGIDIARRTVAKYRAQLGIPSTRQRRQY